MAVAVFIDWENVSHFLRDGRFPPERFSKSVALKRLFEWIRSEVDDIFDTFLFTPIHLMYTDYQLFHDHGLVPTTCPKVPLGSPDKKDTVDPILISKMSKWITHPAITHICLVAGDSDYKPVLKAAKKMGLKIMLSALDPALARPGHPPMSKELAEMADISPKTGKPMIHWFSPVF